MSGEPIRYTLTIANPQGLHMRPIAAVVEAASRFQSSVTILKEGQPPANAKSVMSLLGLAAEHGTQITLEIIGSDAGDALKAVVDAIEKTCEE